MIKRESIDKVRESADIVEIVGRYLPLKKVGKYYRGICPFHPDKSPSFYVSPERQVYHCFGCGAGGSAITFVMQYEKLSFPEAVKSLADKMGIVVQVERVNLKNQPLYDACEFAAKFYQQQLMKYSAAVNYLLKRGMKDETVLRFRLGYAPGGNLLRQSAQKAGISEEVLLKAGLLAQRERGISDWFFSRVVCPIMSLSGKVIGFSGRVLDDSEPKYLNSTETEIFRKGESLFGLFQARNYLRADAPILVEGNFDLLALVNRSINNVVAPLGTAFTYEQALLLKRFNPQVRILFDADSAGRTAARRTLEVLLRAGLEPSVARLPDDYDPDDYIREFGREKLLAAVAAAADPLDFLLLVRHPESVSERNAVLREVLQLLSMVPDEVLRELYLNRTAELFQVGKDVLRGRLSKPEPVSTGPGLPRPKLEKTALTMPEKLLAVAAQDPALVEIARTLLPPETFDQPFLKDIAARLYQLHAHGLVQLIDSLADEESKRRAAAWEFLVQSRPTPAEFTRLARSLRSKWLCQGIAEADAKGDAETAGRLRQEHYELRRKVLQEES